MFQRTMIKVAFIDDGINKNFLNDIIINESIKLYEDKSDNTPDNVISHGTICALIFSKFVDCKDIYLVDIRISNYNSKGTLENFIDAINWCAQNDIDIINISLGTTNNNAFSAIKSAINNVVKKGHMIIAAMDNNNNYSLPACIHGVIGVKSSTIYLNGSYKLRWYPMDGIEIMTSGQHSINIYGREPLITSNKNSFATPVITAYVVNIFSLYGKKQYDEALLMLSKNATHTVGKYIPEYYPYFWNCLKSDNQLSWDKKQFSVIVQKYLKYNIKEIPVPAIMISRNNVEASCEFLNEFSDWLKDDYYHLILSDEFLNLERDIVFPSRCSKQVFMSCVYELYKPNLLLIYTKEKVDADISIFIDNDICLSYKDEKAANISIKYPLNEKRKLYATIIQLLT